VRISGDGKITWENASASNKYLLEMRVAGDSYPRFKIRADGQIEWGSGSAAPDVTLYRSGADTLATINRFVIVSNTLQLSGGSSGISVINISVAGDTNDRFKLFNTGVMQWGSGSSPLDCSLHRRAANILNTPDRLEVGTLGVGNSAAGSTLGNVVKKIEVFDNAGNSLGFLAVYDSIS